MQWFLPFGDVLGPFVIHYVMESMSLCSISHLFRRKTYIHLSQRGISCDYAYNQNFQNHRITEW